jgi:adenine C2-methylase RlmN of 23S rRNA A2503 and tRNA A37
MSTFTVTPSHEDRSVNHVLPTPDGGAWEARFVQRTDPYWICYLSSHTGCNKSCRFCHLTATGQVTMFPAGMGEFMDQARAVFDTYDERMKGGMTRPETVHFNFMARGEPLANPTVLENPDELWDRLGRLATVRGLTPKIKVSSIIPADFDTPLESLFGDGRAQLYYSLYSIDPNFRKRWLPKALNPFEALDRIAAFQQSTGQGIVLHNAFIAGQNDSDQSVINMMDAVLERGIKAKFNLVRYNPHDARHGVEPDEARVNAIFAYIQERLGNPRSRIVPRVGFDVKASCGMFVVPGES